MTTHLIQEIVSVGNWIS